MSARRAYQLCDAVEVIQSLGCEQDGCVTNGGASPVNQGTHPLPPTERHARALASLTLKKRREAWRRAVELAGGGVPAVADVQEAVEWVKSNLAESAGSTEDLVGFCSAQQKKSLAHIRRAITCLRKVAVLLESTHFSFRSRLTEIAHDLERLCHELEI